MRRIFRIVVNCLVCDFYLCTIARLFPCIPVSAEFGECTAADIDADPVPFLEYQASCPEVDIELVDIFRLHWLGISVGISKTGLTYIVVDPHRIAIGLDIYKASEKVGVCDIGGNIQFDTQRACYL